MIFNTHTWAFCKRVHTGHQFLVSSEGLLWGIESVQNFGSGNTHMQSLAQGGHPYLWWPHSIVLNHSFTEWVHLLLATKSGVRLFSADVKDLLRLLLFTHLHFFQNLSWVLLVLAVANTGSCVGPQNEIGHPAHHYRQLMQVPVLSGSGI